MAFPCNQFGAQEPGTWEEIASFTDQKYGVTFPIMGKVNVAYREKSWGGRCAVEWGRVGWGRWDVMGCRFLLHPCMVVGWRTTQGESWSWLLLSMAGPGGREAVTSKHEKWVWMRDGGLLVAIDTGPLMHPVG